MYFSLRSKEPDAGHMRLASWSWSQFWGATRSSHLPKLQRMILCGALGCCISAHQRQLVLWSLVPRPHWQAKSHEHLLWLTMRESQTEQTSRSISYRSLAHPAARGLLVQLRRTSCGTSGFKSLFKRLQRDCQALSRLHCNYSVTEGQALCLA